MTAERLREAARVLRERAEAAESPGPWQEIEDEWGNVPSFTVYGGEGLNADVTGGCLPPGDAQYIASMHPGVGLALARAMSTAADAMEHGDLCLDCFHPTCLTVGELIPVADLILGDAS